MNNKLIIQLIKTNLEEIQNLINHFHLEENDLESGFPMLESRLASLNQDIEILKLNLSKQTVSEDKIQVSEITQSILETESINQVKELPPKIIEKENLSESEVSNKINNTEASVEKITAQESPSINTEPSLSTLNDKLQASMGNDSQLKIPKSKLIDIQSAMGINDQFLFMRELFDNNSVEYKAAIAYINTQDDYQEIAAHFNQEKHWNAEDPTVVQFFDLIKRKFK